MEMKMAVGAANWLLGKVLTKLFDPLVSAYMASSKLGSNFLTAKNQLMYTQGLLSASMGRDVGDDPGLRGLLGTLSKKADEAEDVLDELHYFIIQDEVYGTRWAAWKVGGCFKGHSIHGRHVARHAFGNCLTCFSCPVADRKLPFNRVAMSKKIKAVIEEMNSICMLVSDLLKTANYNNTALSTHVTIERPPTGSTVLQNRKLYGRNDIFEQTVNALTGGMYHDKTLSVLPFVGPGGIGKTTFTQHLYNDQRVKGHFPVRVWVCVSTTFDVIRLTREILGCISGTNAGNTSETTNLNQLQRAIAEKLDSKRFLIVLDDVWTCRSERDWENLLAPFTIAETKGSMVLVTTRLPSVAHMVKTTDPVELHGLEPDAFFALFEACIFGHNKPRLYDDDLVNIARDIAKKLKGSPLAANTVGRLLKKNISWEYWMGILEKNEWQSAQNDDDILPSLQISYNYLPFHLQKCFFYCALFPEDYKFNDLEKITNFWIAMGIVDSNCQNDKDYLDELVDNGFLIKDSDRNGEYYVMHDLLHELSRNVSSQECLNISSLSFRVNDIPQSIRHLSITVQDKYDESFGQEICKLKSVIDIGNLRTLMIFELHDVETCHILADAFEGIKNLRVLFIPSVPNSLPKSFSNLIHLQYLTIKPPRYMSWLYSPRTLPRFYHLKFLDLNDFNCLEFFFPKNISRLVSLRHIYSCNEFHSIIPEVGKMKWLQELREFHVMKESVGFELSQLGELTELGGQLAICNLETVASKKEASDVKLKDKRNLKQLKLVWGAGQQITDGDVLEGLQPPPNLTELSIINYGFAAGPSWLCNDISIKRLESLHLKGISWNTLPPFEQLPYLTNLILENIAGMRVFRPGFSGLTERSFMHLKTVIIGNMPELEEWVGGPNGPLFSRLESIVCRNCPLMSSFSFLECCTNLCRLHIVNCPELSQLPPLPHTSTLTDFSVNKGFSSGLAYDGKCLSAHGYEGALAFQNMDKVEDIYIRGSPHVSLSMSDLQKMKSLRELTAKGCASIFSAEWFNPVVLEELAAHDKSLDKKNISVAADLIPEVPISKWLHPGSFHLEEMKVESISAVLIAPICRRLAATLHTLRFCHDEVTETVTEEQEQALNLLTSLQSLDFAGCKLRSLPRLYGLSSLEELSIKGCDGIQSLPPKEDLPASLLILDVGGCSHEIKEQAEKLKEANPCLSVEETVYYFPW